MFIYFLLINSSVTTWLGFLLLIISAIISSRTINILHFLSRSYSSIFLETSFTLFKYSIKAFRSSGYSRSIFSCFLKRYWYFASFVVVIWQCPVQYGKYFPNFSYFAIIFCDFWNSSKLWGTRKIFAHIAQGNVP